MQIRFFNIHGRPATYTYTHTHMHTHTRTRPRIPTSTKLMQGIKRDIPLHLQDILEAANIADPDTLAEMSIEDIQPLSENFSQNTNKDDVKLLDKIVGVCPNEWKDFWTKDKRYLLVYYMTCVQ